MFKKFMARQDNALTPRMLIGSIVAAIAFIVVVVTIDSFTGGKESGLSSVDVTAIALPDQNGRLHSLNHYLGTSVALAFLPGLDGDSVEELRSINREIRRFDLIGLKVFGVAAAERSLVKRLHDAEKFEFPILVDEKGTVSSQFGLGNAKAGPPRASFLIGKNGRILLPVRVPNPSSHGTQLIELTECCVQVVAQEPSKLLGTRIDDFSLPRVSDGAPESLYGDRTQNATVLFIMSAECPCSAKYDGRNCDLARQYGPRGIRFLAMDSNSGESRAQIAEFCKTANYPYPVLHDVGNIMADKLQARVTPEVFVMDSGGRLAYHGRIDDNRNPALVSSHDLRNALDFLLGGQAPPRREGRAFGCAISRQPKAASSTESVSR